MGLDDKIESILDPHKKNLVQSLGKHLYFFTYLFEIKVFRLDICFHVETFHAALLAHKLLLA